MKRIYSLFTLLLVALAMTAAPISFATARQAAQRFLKAHGGQLKSEALRAPRKTAMPDGNAEGDDAAYYVFNATASKGFVIVSGDDCVGDNLVLGYATQGSFDADNVPENMQSWFDDMGKQIAELSRLGVKAKTIALHEDIDILVTSLWGQGENDYNPIYPYNRFCPETDGLMCVSGCMATALAQVMYYHRWPQALTASLPSYKMANERVIDELPAVTFDWDNMQDFYFEKPTTETQQEAVATLVRYCGQTVQMNYTPQISSGLIYDLDMLITQFGYDPDVYLATSNDYTPSGWDELLYNELKEGRPLVYTGISVGGGHAFVIDGYQVNDGAGYFHVNWGWDGLANGYFKISILQPDYSGTGGSSTSDGYNVFQRALIGLQPASKPIENYGRYLSGLGWNTVENHQYNVMIPINSSYKPGTFSLALAERADDGTVDYTRLYNEQTLEFKGYSYINKEGLIIMSLPDITVEGLEPGTHNLVFVNKESGTNAPWRILFGPASYMEVIVDENGQTTETQIHPMPKLTANSRYFRIEGLKQWGIRQNVSAPIVNNGEDFIGTVGCGVYYVVNDVLSELHYYFSTGCFIESGATCDVNFSLSLPRTGKYVVMLTKADEDKDIKGTKLSDIKKAKGYIVHKTINIDDLAFYCQSLTYNDKFDDYYFDIQLVNNTSMDYDATLLAYLYRLNDEGEYTQFLNYDPPYLSTDLKLNSKSSDTILLFLPEALESGQYYIQMFIANDFHSSYLKDYFPFVAGPFSVDATVDIAALENDGTQSLSSVVYDLQGRRMDNAQFSSKKGIYIKNGKKIVIK